MSVSHTHNNRTDNTLTAKSQNTPVSFQTKTIATIYGKLNS